MWQLANDADFVSQIVSIHTPTKGVTFCAFSKSLALFCFNPHTHEGCDRNHNGLKHFKKGFNPHTHEGCDLWIFLKLAVVLQFQSTHPRRVWLPSTYSKTTHFVVSIHTPTKGVTVLSLSWIMLMLVSIHTPTKGVTSLPMSFLIVPLGFNPHTHEGCDTTVTMVLSVLVCFNPHTHEGCD